MPESPAQIGARFYAPLFRDGADLVQTIRDDARCEEAAALIKPEAPIRFITPDGGRVGGLSNEFKGMEGYRSGWLEWLEPFEEFHLIPESTLEAGPGRVLFLAHTVARPQGSQAEIEQGVGVLVAVEDDLVAAIDQYLDQEQAKRAAGLSG
jgi:hypothetical protein